MKILCLHGYGTSGSIMEKQFADVCAGLDETYEYVYLDGEYETKRAAGMALA